VVTGGEAQQLVTGGEAQQLVTRWRGPTAGDWDRWRGPAAGDRWRGLAAGDRWRGPAAGDRWIGPAAGDRWRGPAAGARTGGSRGPPDHPFYPDQHLSTRWEYDGRDFLEEPEGQGWRRLLQDQFEGLLKSGIRCWRIPLEGHTP
ncbi:hypothetical protein Hamer_G007471, partial [Homarus americanus]